MDSLHATYSGGTKPSEVPTAYSKSFCNKICNLAAQVFETACKYEVPIGLTLLTGATIVRVGITTIEVYLIAIPVLLFGIGTWYLFEKRDEIRKKEVEEQAKSNLNELRKIKEKIKEMNFDNRINQIQDVNELAPEFKYIAIQLGDFKDLINRMTLDTFLNDLKLCLDHHMAAFNQWSISFAAGYSDKRKNLQFEACKKVAKESIARLEKTIDGAIERYDRYLVNKLKG